MEMESGGTPPVSVATQWGVSRVSVQRDGESQGLIPMETGA